MTQKTLIIPIAWRSLWRNSRRTLITFAAIAVGVWSMITLAAFMDAWVGSVVHEATNNLTGHGQIHQQGYLDDPSVEYRFSLPPASLDEAMESPQIKAWNRRVRVPGIVRSERESAPITLIGLDPAREVDLSFYGNELSSGRQPKEGRTAEIVLGRRLAERLHTRIGKRVVILSQNSSGEIAESGLRVVGLFDASLEEIELGFVFITLQKAQSLLDIKDAVHEVAFTLYNPEEVQSEVDRLKQVFSDLDVSTWSDLQPLAQTMQEMSAAMIGVWTVIMFIIIAFGMVNTLLMAVYERTREFGLLQALGMKPRLILSQVLLEAAFMVGIGVVVGMVISILSIYAFTDGLDLGPLAAGADLFGSGRVLYPKLDLIIIFAISSFVWIMGILSCLWPAWRAARQVPVTTINQSY
ncbi:MAG: FtsX-like permease family protein [Arenicellales bacterium]|jgi:ABC-type lipoprotein release transport system permease subunit|nr:FtsX-like permease family protein [Arenicellales bacterium]|tara:strand:- start:1024 stop:2253 length:1230 start_codon:yes stop_codon:yes gene_type:complete